MKLWQIKITYLIYEGRTRTARYRVHARDLWDAWEQAKDRVDSVSRVQSISLVKKGG